MDDQQFDRLTRVFSSPLPRREAALLVSGALGLFLTEPVEAGPTLGKRPSCKRRCNKRGRRDKSRKWRTNTKLLKECKITRGSE